MWSPFSRCAISKSRSEDDELDNKKSGLDVGEYGECERVGVWDDVAIERDVR